MKMLERESQLATLHDHAQQAAEGKGRLVFLAAESGGGKTTLVEQLAATLPDEFRMAIVSCDGLKMPGPFGPLFDIATALGPDVETLLRDLAPRDRIFRAVLSALHAAPQPQVIVGEDAHWTDEASLELIRFLGRRLSGTKTLIIVTYREDMLGPYHPLRRVLGDLINEPAVTRITLPPLSLEAVRTLAAGTGIDPVALHERTGGNPFYVTEIVAAGDVTLPDSIRDAVLARAAPLSAETRAVLDVAATISVIFDPGLLEAVIGGPIADAVDECLASGMTPVNDGAQNVVLARIILGPGGSVGEHTHPGTVVFTVESGVLGFTHLGDMEMTVTRAATANAEAVVEPLPHGEEVALNPGDTYVESGMVHTASNLSDGDTTVLMSGLMEAGQPLTVCVDGAATPAH